MKQNTWAQVAQKTILSAMEYATIVKDPESPFDREARLNRRCTAAIRYIADRLSLSVEQAELLTGACYLTATQGRGFDNEDICKFLGLHPFRALGIGSQLDELDNLGYIMQHADCRENWVVTPQALDAIRADHAFDPESLRSVDNLEFLREVHVRVKAGQRNDRDGKIRPAVERLFRLNDHLNVVKNLRKQPEEGRWVLLLMMITLYAEGDNYVNTRDLEMVLRTADVRRIIRDLQRNIHPYAQKGWIKPYGQDGMANSSQWCLSPECWQAMLEDEDQVTDVTGAESPVGNLTEWKNLTQKELFFSGKTAEEVARLRQLLSHDTYSRIHDELIRRNMPRGFCCLLYGTPGTGKTELVQQIAIETQRDIMQIDIAGLRDKYVGETEKMVKQVFDMYRKAVQMAERAPILFFNEADAIFGNRMERTEHSVDKMENAMQNIILQEMETLDGILICTTNLTSTLDKAFDRRFLYKIEFQKPDREARRQIWQSMLDNLSDDQAKELADRFNFSGGQILNISRKQVINAIFTGNNDLDYDRILKDCSAETIERNNGKRVGF